MNAALHRQIPSLAISLGDPAGIGPEVVLKALALAPVRERCRPIVHGSRKLIEGTYWQLRERSVAPLAAPDSFEIVDLPAGGPVAAGIVAAGAGDLSFAYLQSAIEAVQAGQAAGIVTAPIHKSAWHLAGHRYPGQTEVLAHAFGSERYGMLFAARPATGSWALRVLLATTHIPLAQVSASLSPQLLRDKLQLLFDSLKRDFGLDEPLVAVAGLNPHAGENGQIGSEEREWLTALIAEWQQRGYRIKGPVPPDTLWIDAARAWAGEPAAACDGYLALYHDQGLIPVKMLAFDQAVNTTIGLPIVRTSPDHGTAFDIVGQGVARHQSMVAAIELAAELAGRRASLSVAHAR
ncbi:4-hydroxythreonine-4-phosphate dehydrogenase PdxA [Gloeobacter kilaueensis]|uniref:4-hydroxythreonine-4-phosphate dehydrogenase n=1 Tax=Gloeobacter kilaueensis (strain ATCC BAA-2537 / CCAP 1431/1 / ULC 316 / JS1) TaxID=1183438 RepID=U5QHY4_GLOK1|nr:4-hydroxythreonine-4-phosphate dehydrogenase PdxA [Gloeobacter kilaueensis]AGY58587.1 4-hydroxythreonine-4-phosphate dehydrogenase [Gloeobacter kilaueensis JS1]